MIQCGMYMRVNEVRFLIEGFTLEEDPSSLYHLGRGLTAQAGKRVDELGNEMKKREERRRWERREKEEKDSSST